MEIYSRHIAIKNIYYMLSYAFKALQEKNMSELATESFEDMLDLMSAILIKGVAYQIKHGLLHNYENLSEEMSYVRGRILIDETLKNRSLVRKKLYCNHDEYTENTLFNKILKTTMLYIMSSDISDKKKQQLRRQYAYFGNVDIIYSVKTIRWTELKYNRNNSHYELLMNICNLVLTSMLPSTESGSVKLKNYCDEQKMYRLYEKFILEYYKKHFPKLYPCAPEIKWALYGDADELLPKMQSDTILRKRDKTLIIDAKFYSFITQSQYENKKYRNSNMYQIFTYVKNEEKNTDKNVSGILLYAKTDDNTISGSTYNICGNDIAIKMLDLGQDFESIKNQLNNIVYEYFGI